LSVFGGRLSTEKFRFTFVHSIVVTTLRKVGTTCPVSVFPVKVVPVETGGTMTIGGETVPITRKTAASGLFVV
jgi:hypothetical protein